MYGVRPQMLRALTPVFFNIGVTPINFSKENASKYIFNVHEPLESTDFISHPAYGQILISEIHGVYSEGLSVLQAEHESDLNWFKSMEIEAALAYVQSNVSKTRPIPYTSLLEQWKIISRSDLRVPDWKLDTPLVGERTTLIIDNMYEYRYDVLASGQATIDYESALLSTSIPPGRRALFHYSPQTTSHLYDNGTEWMFYNPSSPVLEMLNDLRNVVIANIGYRIAVIEYFYCGEITFWSVSPFVEPWLLSNDSRSALLHDIALHTLQSVR